MKKGITAAFVALGTLSAVPASAGTLLYVTAYSETTGVGVSRGTNNSSANATGPSIAQDAISYGGASAQVRANVTTGQLGVQATGSAGHRGQGAALLTDVLTFSIAGANAATQTAIGFSWLIHGSYTDAAGGFGFATSELRVGDGAAASASIFSGQANSFYSGNFRDASWSSIGGDRYLFTGTYDLTGATAVVPIRAYLQAAAIGPITAAFGNTASIGLSLPTNVTYTSASGDFLTATAAVPEPATWAMMILGFGVVGASMRRRKSNVRTSVRFA